VSQEEPATAGSSAPHPTLAPRAARRWPIPRSVEPRPYELPTSDPRRRGRARRRTDRQRDRHHAV